MGEQTRGGTNTWGNKHVGEQTRGGTSISGHEKESVHHDGHSMASLCVLYTNVSTHIHIHTTYALEKRRTFAPRRDTDGFSTTRGALTATVEVDGSDTSFLERTAPVLSARICPGEMVAPAPRSMTRRVSEAHLH